jgi:outer membrane lipoprotein SlyB
LQTNQSLERKMESPKTHPLIITAAVAIILASGVAIAAMTGILPSSEAKLSEQQKVEQAKQEQEKEEAEAKEEAKAIPPITHSTSQKTNTEPPAQVAAVCHHCGRVSAVRTIHHQGEGSGIGAVAGGVTGAVVGKQFGNGRGQTAMTVAGAVGGALLGNHIEKEKRSTTSYQVVVHFDDGTSHSYNFQNRPQWQSGDRVRVSNGELTQAD